MSFNEGLDDGNRKSTLEEESWKAFEENAKDLDKRMAIEKILDGHELVLLPPGFNQAREKVMLPGNFWFILFPSEGRARICFEWAVGRERGDAEPVPDRQEFSKDSLPKLMGKELAEIVDVAVEGKAFWPGRARITGKLGAALSFLAEGKGMHLAPELGKMTYALLQSKDPDGQILQRIVLPALAGKYG